MKTIVYIIGTFLFGAAPLVYTWLDGANAAHSYDLGKFFYSPEGWIYCIALASAVIVDVSNEKPLGVAQFGVGVICTALLGFASFEYAEMLSEIRKLGDKTNFPYWSSAQGHFIAASIFFAIVVKITQRWRETAEKRYPWD